MDVAVLVSPAAAYVSHLKLFIGVVGCEEAQMCECWNPCLHVMLSLHGHLFPSGPLNCVSTAGAGGEA